MYTYNGKTYQSLDAMPPEVRRLFEDQLGALRAGGTTGQPMGAKVEVTRYEAHGADLAEVLAKLPPDARVLLRDENRDGIPDILQGAGGGAGEAAVRQSFEVNGQRYDSLDAMPAEVRADFEGALRRLGPPGRPGFERPTARASAPGPAEVRFLRDAALPSRSSGAGFGRLAVIVGGLALATAIYLLL